MLDNTVVIGERPLQLKSFKDPVSGNYYVIVRELATYLGVKQPFEFTREIRSWRNNAIVSGGYTDSFRPRDERKNTPFIEVHSIVDALRQTDIEYKFRLKHGMKYRVIKEIDEFLNSLQVQNNTLSIGDEVVYERLAGIYVDGEVTESICTEEGRYVDITFEDGEIVRFPDMISKTSRLMRKEK